MNLLTSHASSMSYIQSIIIVEYLRTENDGKIRFTKRLFWVYLVLKVVVTISFSFESLYKFS